MKYDDASWHGGGDFPPDSPAEFGGTHIALMLKWCFLKGWAGELHTEESPEDLERLLRGEMSATEYFFTYCDGKFTDEDLTAEGNAFVGVYYGDHGAYLTDYEANFGRQMYVASEAEHDVAKFSAMVERRYQEYLRPKTRRPWWKLW